VVCAWARFRRRAAAAAAAFEKELAARFLEREYGPFEDLPFGGDSGRPCYGATMRIEVSDGYHLTSVTEGDRERLVDLLSDGQVARWIPALPQPYTRQVADSWIKRRASYTQRRPEISFAIRNPVGIMVGSVGVDELRDPSQHDGELGYWVDPAERGRGLATRAVEAFVPYAFGVLGLARLTAHTLAFNVRSVRVLEKSSFILEGRLRRRTRTATGYHDTLVFGRLRPDL